MARRPSKWSKHMIIESIRRHRASGHTLIPSRMLEIDSLLVGAAIRHFGSWRQAVEEAGADYGLVLRRARQLRSRNLTKWTPRSILWELRRLWELGEDVRVSTMRLRLPGLSRAAVKHYRSWASVLAAAGIPPQSAHADSCHRRGWKTKWLRRLSAQAAGRSDSDEGSRRDYRRAFAAADTVSWTDWLDRLRSRHGR